MSTLNLGILAHVDAGKTSLTERLLYAAGVIGQVGSVDDGSTQTDSLALERQRGLTIKSAVVSFAIGDVTVNLIDTPGHPDFIAEVERVLSVLDGAVLVVSAVEGVQAQTRILMRTLRRLRIPTLLFVNKIDRGGARYDGVLCDVAEKLTPAIVAMGTVERLGTRFAPPTLETVVVPRGPGERGRLHAALAQLAEQDPLIDLRQDDLRQELSVSLYGEVQKEVIQATLADEFGLEVTFRESTTICIERPAGTGAAVEHIGRAPNPFLATVGLRVEPAPVGSGVRYRLEVELGSLPLAFHKAVEETVERTLLQGIHGWQVTDCVVTMTHSDYWARQSHAHGTFDKSMSSTAGDFRDLTPLVLMGALQQAGTRVYEPMHRFHLEIPADAFGSILPVLAAHRAVPGAPSVRGSICLLEGEIPAVRVHRLQQRLPALTRGEGVLESTFHRYQPVRGAVPTRPRSDHNPLNRKEYLLHVLRRVGNPTGART